MLCLGWLNIKGKLVFMLSEETSYRNILIVARWPLGGIRTYMRYMFRYFPENYRLTLLAASTQEDSALTTDAQEYGAILRLIENTSLGGFIYEIAKALNQKRYQLIISQGFLSAVAVHVANLIYRVPHILTIHGIVEPQYLSGRFRSLKRWLLSRTLLNVTILYGVGKDILECLYLEFPNVRCNGPTAIVISNGVDPSEFESKPLKPVFLRKQLGVDPAVFLFGFFGRFMPQKGFDLLIDSVDCIRTQCNNFSFAIVAVGSGDYIREYQVIIKEKGLEDYFHFLPFRPMVHHLYPQMDAIIMPSRWEASPLLAMETLCMGTPLIASDCMGLRETVNGTPAFVFPFGRSEKLSEMMCNCMQDRKYAVFQAFKTEARQRFHVAFAAEKLVKCIEQVLGRG